MEQTDTEGPAIGPSGRGLEVGEDVLGVVAAVLSNGQDGDHDGNEASQGPEDGNSLGKSQNQRTVMGTRADSHQAWEATCFQRQTQRCTAR